MLTQTHDIRGILWDLDNTLYRCTQEIHDTFNTAIARAALQLGVNLPFDQACAVAHESFLKTRYSGAVFVENYNISPHDLHSMSVDFLDHTLVSRCNDTVDMFGKHGHPHALITHAARPWAQRILDRLGLRGWFPEDRIFAFENYNFESKARSQRPFEMALSSINLDPENVLMVEDTIENLQIPKRMGMTTVFVHHGDTPADIPDFVDFACRNACDVLGLLHSSASR